MCTFNFDFFNITRSIDNRNCSNISNLTNRRVGEICHFGELKYYRELLNHAMKVNSSCTNMLQLHVVHKISIE